MYVGCICVEVLAACLPLRRTENSKVSHFPIIKLALSLILLSKFSCFAPTQAKLCNVLL